LHAAQKRGLCELIGARPTHKSEASHPMVAPFLAAHNVPILEAVPDCDLIFSAGNHHIFKAAEIAKAKRGIINFHAAPLPEYAGSAAPAFAILNEESQFGVTFHYIIPEIDAGDILHVERFPIDAHWTAKELDGQCVSVGLGAFARLVDKFIDGTIEASPATIGSRLPYRRSEIESYREIDLSWSADRIWRHVRACDWEGILPPAYVSIGGRTVFVTARTRGTWL
jgi:methionyl-tRNA formyltransferase